MIGILFYGKFCSGFLWELGGEFGGNFVRILCGDFVFIFKSVWKNTR